MNDIMYNLTQSVILLNYMKYLLSSEYTSPCILDHLPNTIPKFFIQNIFLRVSDKPSRVDETTWFQAFVYIQTATHVSPRLLCKQSQCAPHRAWRRAARPSCPLRALSCAPFGDSVSDHSPTKTGIKVSQTRFTVHVNAVHLIRKPPRAPSAHSQPGAPT